MSRAVSNVDVAAILGRIGDLLEIQGESKFKVIAYRRAAENVMALGRDLRAIHAEGGLAAVPGFGAAIVSKVAELLDTGSLGYYTKLTAEVPPSLSDLLRVPDLGPKKVKAVWEQLGVVDLAGLEAAATAGKLQALPGFGKQSEARILEGLRSLAARPAARTLLGRARPIALALAAELRQLPGVHDVVPAGSLRRWRETIGDIDLLASADDAGPVIRAFIARPEVSRVLGEGPVKASVELASGLRCQLWVHPPEHFGSALVYATGSKEHGVRLRELALQRGWSLSEHGMKRLDGEGQQSFATEAEVYAALGLAYVPPELREDRGEVRAARDGTLPAPLDPAAVRASLHNHSTWSDGKASILEMAQAAMARGYTTLAITDHSAGLGITQGLAAEDLPRQRLEIDAVQAEVGDGLRLLQGVELEIRADGTLDFPDDVLARLDIVVASLHVSLRQPREQITARLLAAVANPHVDVIGHPTGRLLPDRDGADLDMDAILAAAKAHGVALEINANPRRLDLGEAHARRAQELGIPLSINTDAHHPDHLDFLEYGVAVARRGWVEADSVINCWPRQRLMDWLAGRGGS